MNREKTIKDLEIQSAIKSFFKDNKLLEIPYFIDEKETQIPQSILSNYLNEFIVYLHNNNNIKIYGSEVEFNLNLYRDYNSIYKICKHIWDNPEKYYPIENKDDYYEFLKFLWVEIDGQKYDLGDIALMKETKGSFGAERKKFKEDFEYYINTRL